MDSSLFGTGVALVTPFRQDLSIDYEGLLTLLAHVTNGGVDYLVVCGTTGESATLNKSEKNELLGFVKKNNSGNLSIVYGIGGNNTQDCLQTIDDTDFNGVKAILSVSPYYNKPSQNGIIRHYEAIASKSPVPVILYNVPGRTSSNLNWDTTVELSRHDNIIGIKEASGDLVQCMKLRRSCSEDFLLISGDDLLTGPILSIGGAGVISVLANAFPDRFSAIMKAFQTRDFTGISSETNKLLDINPLMYAESNPVGIKEVLRQLEICSGYVRLPLIEASEGLKKGISEVLVKVKT